MARKKTRKKPNIIDDSDFLVQEQLLTLLHKLGLKTVPDWYRSDWEFVTSAALSNFGKPDMLIMDDATLKAYQKVFKK